ncbi:hypothetical protein HYH03_013446 [Edaphochlamys debaryana]|uniref:Ion transport domain-containing protein n=1 Tax=Edaphochlamys debaryana TaxID=47281 RepID=A0A835XQT0_9CHLO|nr:hypothetical protein HYH03_013446 [Edaphochlamys debaryana]|eukprot:KAG2488009.1 hypothetical protein HYH03_013446 [Edaphochlamys debaryana]
MSDRSPRGGDKDEDELEEAGGIGADAGVVGRTVELKRQAVDTLSEETRRFLHVNAHGKPLPTWMKYDNQPSLSRYSYHMSRLHSLMTDPGSSTWANIVSYFMVLTIAISVIGFCLETLPVFKADCTAIHVFWYIEAITIQIFAIDYLLRIVSAPDKLKFVMEPFNIIDLVAIVPWYILIIVTTASNSSASFSGTSVFRVVRLARVFRVLKLGGRYSKLIVVLGALRKSLDMLGLMVFFISLCILFFATLEYYVERGTWDEQLGYYVRPMAPPGTTTGSEPVCPDLLMPAFAPPAPPSPNTPPSPPNAPGIDCPAGCTAPASPPPVSPFESIVSGFWWAIVTLMTVGYGDVTPVTGAGKFIACLAMICGVLTLALPISVIGSTFSSDWTAHLEEQEKLQQEQRRGAKLLATTSPALLEFQKLLDEHLTNAAILVDTNHASELALDERARDVHEKLRTMKANLVTEARADLTLRRAARTVPVGVPMDRVYGYLPEEHVRERYAELLPELAPLAASLGSRARHTARIAAVNEALLDADLTACDADHIAGDHDAGDQHLTTIVRAVRRLVRKHADLIFLLNKDLPLRLREVSAELTRERQRLASLEAAATARKAAATAAASTAPPTATPSAAASYSRLPHQLPSVGSRLQTLPSSGLPGTPPTVPPPTAVAAGIGGGGEGGGSTRGGGGGGGGEGIQLPGSMEAAAGAGGAGAGGVGGAESAGGVGAGVGPGGGEEEAPVAVRAAYVWKNKAALRASHRAAAQKVAEAAAVAAAAGAGAARDPEAGPSDDPGSVAIELGT